VRTNGSLPQELAPPWRFSALSAEVRLTVLLFALSFFIAGVPRVYTQTAAHTLFIQEFGAAAIPWAYLAQALCVPLAGSLYMFAERRVSLRALLVGTLVAQLVVLVLFRLGLGFGVHSVVAVTMVYFEIEFVLSSLLLWGLSSQLMNLRQGKRRFSFISAGEPVAIIVCGLSMPLLLHWLSVADLFLFSALGVAVGIGLVLHILRQHEVPADAVSDDEAEIDLPKEVWWKNNYVVMMVVMVAVGQMAYFLVDSAFYTALDKRYPSEQDMASFLGMYSAAVGSISLSCSVLLGPWLVRRYGVRGGLLTLPSFLLTGSLALVLCAVLDGPTELLFFLVVCNKVIDQSFRYTLDKSTFVTLFQPLPANQRIQVQAGLESIVEPLTGGLAGLLLFAMINLMGFGAAGITGVVLAVTCVWVGLVGVQYRAYLGMLRTAIAGRKVSADHLSLCDDASRALLHQGLCSERPAEVLYCLSVLDAQQTMLTEHDALLLMRHPSRDVRLHMAHRAERSGWSVATDKLAAVAASEPDGEVQGVLLEALAAHEDDKVLELTAYLNSADERVRLGACAGLIRHGGVEGVLAVAPALLEDLHAIEPRRRRFAAQVMARACSDHFYRPLLALLRDPDVGVAREALRAAGRIRVAKLWPVMLECVSKPALERPAINALAGIGDVLLPMLDDFLERQTTRTALRCTLFTVLQQMGTPAADQRLVRQLTKLLPDSMNINEYNCLLRALWRRRVRCQAEHGKLLRKFLLSEVQSVVGVLHVWRSVHHEPAASLALLQRVAQDRVTRSIENVFTLLALTMAEVDVHEAYAIYSRGEPARRSYVIEMLESHLDADAKYFLLPLIEAENMSERVAKVLGLPGNSQHGQVLPMGELLGVLAANAQASSLLRACAIYAAADSGAAWFSGIENSPNDDQILQETLHWGRSGCPGSKERKFMLTIEKMLILRGAALFAAVREEYVAHAALMATEIRLAAGQVLFQQGDPGTAMFVVASGELEVQVDGERVNLIGEREVVGEMAVLDPEPRSATVLALTDSLLLRITSEDLDLLMSEDVEVARGIIQTLCQRLRLRDVDRELGRALPTDPKPLP